jgi:putative ABC transport system permease protein
MVGGAWWDSDAKRTPKAQLAHVVMEDREADQLQLQVGDRLTFSVHGEMLDARLSGIYKQKGLQTRFWFEAIFSDGALDAFIHRYIGAGYMDDATAKEVQGQIAEIAPNVVSVRTASILETARGLLRKASAGLGEIAIISLCVSLLVLTGVMAATRTRHIYEATILHSLGARLSVIRHALMLEYGLLAVITSLFSTVFGTAITWSLLAYRLKLDSDVSFAFGFLIPVVVSTLCLFFGASYLLRRLRVRPAVLLRSGG